MNTKQEGNNSFITIAVAVMLIAWFFGSCQRNAILRTCGNNPGEYAYSWKGENKIACVIKKGRSNDLKIVTPNGTGKGSFKGNYVVGNAGGRKITCAGKRVTGLPYGICTD